MSLWSRAAGLSDEIRAEAKQIDPVKVAFTLLMVPFVIVGFVLAHTVKVAWTVLTFMWVSLLVGWRRAGGPEAFRRSGGS
ncbi:MAG TPA: hypothetical protein VIQ30_05450 [Pseudonocardia sp.]